MLTYALYCLYILDIIIDLNRLRHVFPIYLIKTNIILNALTDGMLIHRLVL